MDVLGIDLAKLTFDATLLTDGGEQHYHSFSNTPEGFTPLQTWLSEHGVTQLHACMEATNVYWEALATWLYAQGHTVSVVNPARIKGYAQATMQRNKTDKLIVPSLPASAARTARMPGSRSARPSASCARGGPTGRISPSPTPSTKTACVIPLTRWCGPRLRQAWRWWSS